MRGDIPVIHEETASVGQRMLWLVERHRGGQGRLNYPLVMRLHGRLDTARLRAAIDHLAMRHEALRTTFARRSGLLTQLIHEAAPVPVTRVSIPAGSGGDVDRHLRQEISASIDPTISPIRVTLWVLGEQEHVLCLNAHHMVTDAWSCRVLVEELVHLLGRDDPLPRAGWQYRHFVQWQRRKAASDRVSAEADYWRRSLDGVRPTALPRSEARPSCGRTGIIRLDLDAAAGERIRGLARSARTTPFTVLLALYCCALHRLTGQDDLSVASPVANRRRPEAMRTVGFFANLVVLRSRAAPGTPFLEVLSRAKDTVGGALAHQGFPYYLLPTASGVEGAAHLADVIFQMLPELPAPMAIRGLEVEVLPPQLPSRFDLELAVIPHGKTFRAVVQYATDRMTDREAGRLADAFRSLLAGLASPLSVML